MSQHVVNKQSINQFSTIGVERMFITKSSQGQVYLDTVPDSGYAF